MPAETPGPYTALWHITHAQDLARMSLAPFPRARCVRGPRAVGEGDPVWASVKATEISVYEA